MEKITIKFDDVLLEKINNRMEKKGCKSLSQCARELIDLGLKIEEAALLQEDKIGEGDLHPTLLNILKTNLSWSLETRFLARFLVEKIDDIDSDQKNNFMKEAKEKASSYVDEFIQNIKKII